VGEHFPQRLARALRVQIPDGVDDRRHRDVDDAFLRAEPAELRVAGQVAPERRRRRHDVVERAADHERLVGADRAGADLVAAADGEGEAVAFEPRVRVQDDVGGGIVGIGVDGIGAGLRQRRRKTEVDDLQAGDLHALTDRTRSSVTAATMMPPVTICWTQLASPFCEHPIWMTVMIAAPMIVPATVPRPPDRLPPPMMTAAITSSSRPMATVGSPTDSFENCSSPAMPASAAPSV